MAQASALEPTGMAAIIGGEIDQVEAALAAAGLHPANYNGGGQVVAAGAQSALDAFAAEPPAGMRVIPLTVAGAFHTPYMAGAVHTLAEAAATTSSEDPRSPLYTNRDGSRVTSGKDALGYLVDQVARPVRWDYCMASFAQDNIEGMIELAPAGALAGLAKRALKGTPTVALNNPDDINTARDMVVAS